MTASHSDCCTSAMASSSRSGDTTRSGVSSSAAHLRAEATWTEHAEAADLYSHGDDERRVQRQAPSRRSALLRCTTSLTRRVRTRPPEHELGCRSAHSFVVTQTCAFRHDRAWQLARSGAPRSQWILPSARRLSGPGKLTNRWLALWLPRHASFGVADVTGSARRRATACRACLFPRAVGKAVRTWASVRLSRQPACRRSPGTKSNSGLNCRRWEPTRKDTGPTSADSRRYQPTRGTCLQRLATHSKNSRRDGGIRTRGLLLPKQAR
jgi:hypothetical protein